MAHHKIDTSRHWDSVNNGRKNIFASNYCILRESQYLCIAIPQGSHPKGD